MEIKYDQQIHIDNVIHKRLCCQYIIIFCQYKFLWKKRVINDSTRKYKFQSIVVIFIKICKQIQQCYTKIHGFLCDINIIYLLLSPLLTIYFQNIENTYIYISEMQWRYQLFFLSTVALNHAKKQHSNIKEMLQPFQKCTQK